MDWEIYVFIFDLCLSIHLSVCMYVCTYACDTHTARTSSCWSFLDTWEVLRNAWLITCMWRVDIFKNKLLNNSFNLTHVSLIQHHSLDWKCVFLRNPPVSSECGGNSLPALKTLWYAKGQSSRERSCKPGQGIQRYHMFKDRMQCNGKGQAKPFISWEQVFLLATDWTNQIYDSMISITLRCTYNIW